jgi:hypothetical protein
MILVMGETDVTTFSFSVLEVIVLPLVLFESISEARDSEIDIAKKPRSTTYNDRVTIFVYYRILNMGIIRKY